MKKRTKVDYATPKPDTIETVYVDIDYEDKVKDMSDKRRKEKQQSGSSSKHYKKKKCGHKPHKKSKRHRKEMESSSESEGEVDMKKLREERDRREGAERARADELVNPKPKIVNTEPVPKYNNQFNPGFVKNYKRKR